MKILFSLSPNLLNYHRTHKNITNVSNSCLEQWIFLTHGRCIKERVDGLRLRFFAHMRVTLYWLLLELWSKDGKHPNNMPLDWWHKQPVTMVHILFYIFLGTLIMTSSSGNIFRVTGPLCGEYTGHRWIPLTKASDAERWCFLCSAPE